MLPDMVLVADESVDFEIIKDLRKNGIRVFSISKIFRESKIQMFYKSHMKKTAC
jgi:ABC-type hemin transport system substrate-binding protein